MAEWSKALVLGTSLSGGVGSNPTPVTILISIPKSRASLVQWLEYLPSKQVARVRFPDDAPFLDFGHRGGTGKKRLRLGSNQGPIG